MINFPLSTFGTRVMTDCGMSTRLYRHLQQCWWQNSDLKLWFPCLDSGFFVSSHSVVRLFRIVRADCRFVVALPSMRNYRLWSGVYVLGHVTTCSLACGNKMPTRCNRVFFIADLIAFSTCFGAPLCPSSGAQENYTVVAVCGISCCGFSSSWSGVEMRVMCPVCWMLVYRLVASD